MAVLGEVFRRSYRTVVVAFFPLVEDVEEGAEVPLHDFHRLLCRLTRQEFVGLTVLYEVVGFGVGEKSAVQLVVLFNRVECEVVKALG